MIIRQVEYSKTFNIGNYESLRIGLIAEVQSGENEKEVLQELNKRVHALRETLSSRYKEACKIVQTPLAQAKKLGYDVEKAKRLLADVESMFGS